MVMRGKNSLKMMRTLLIIVTVIVTACSRVTYTMDVDVVGTTVRDLVRGSDVVVVGTVEGEAGTINTSRDPRDITRPHPTIESIAQLYRVRVEEAFKGGPKPEVIVAVSRWSSNVGEVGRENWPQFIALEQAPEVRPVPSPRPPAGRAVLRRGRAGPLQAERPGRSPVAVA